MSDVTKDQYWEQFAIVPADLEYLVNYLLENETPATLPQLAQALVAQRYAHLLSLAEAALSQGSIYRPGETYSVGEKIIFPDMGNLLGEIIAVRPGHNPEYGDFSVAQVQFKTGTSREFATGLSVSHPLNDVVYAPVGELTPDLLWEAYGPRVQAALYESLQSSAQFVTVGEHWFLRELLLEIPMVQLNIAEALLDMAQGGPLSAAALLEELELPAEIAKPLQSFSLEYALERDGRFDEVGPAGIGLWYLQRMEPKNVLEVPERLRYIPLPYNRSAISADALALEQQVDDEWSENTVTGALDNGITEILFYPHWRSGTLPLNARLAQLFPSARVTDRVRFTFVDGDTGKTFPGWVVRSGRYVYGLQDWYTENQVGVGAYLDLRAGQTPGEIEICARRMRSRRGEWVRTVAVRDNRLHFEVTRAPVSCEYDELAAVIVPDPQAVDALANDLRRAPLESLVEQIFSGLSGLSLQRAVHAVTLYSVLNLLRRVPPLPLVATLAMDQRYNALGDNYWAYRGED